MRFRFSIRDLLWLTLVVALVASWSLDHDKILRQLQQVQAHADKQLQYIYKLQGDVARQKRSQEQ